MQIPDQNAAKSTPTPTHDAIMGAWRARIETLVTCLCIGGTHYAREVSRPTVIPGADPVPIERRDPKTGEPVSWWVLPVDYQATPERMASLTRQGDEARAELVVQTGIPAKHWYALATEVMASRRLLAYLEGLRLIPPRPAKAASP